MKVDVIIVGQGLAGTSLAFQLKKRGISCHIFDKGLKHSSSVVAAGLFNPVVYKRLSPVWKIEELLPLMKDFFRMMEEKLEERFLHDKETIKIFSSAQDAENWIKCKNEIVNRFIIREIESDNRVFNQPFGFSRITDTGYLDVFTFLLSARSSFINAGELTEIEVGDEDVKIERDRIAVNGIFAKHIVFCEGARSTKLWANLPFKPVKGELLTVSIPELNVDQILVKDGFLLPLGGDKYLMGSTYVWNDLTPMPSPEGREELEKKLRGIIGQQNYTVLSQQAGIRPASHDRRAYVGFHPQFPNVGILNGFGTRGVLLAPYCSEALADAILDGKQIPSEINVNRVRF